MSKQRLHKNIPLAKAVTMATDTADNSIAPPADAFSCYVILVMILCVYIA